MADRKECSLGGHPYGVDLGGVRTIDDIRDRCFISSDDECWHWRGATEASGRPKFWFPVFRVTTTPGPVIAFLKTGVRPKKARWLNRCRVADCMNPDHWFPSNHSTACKRSKRRNPAVHAIKTTIARRARSKLNEEIIQDIRSRAGIARHYAGKYEISVGHVYRVWAGTNWKPLTAPTSSVFNFAGSL
jgi:hypothetical protein